MPAKKKSKIKAESSSETPQNDANSADQVSSSSSSSKSEEAVQESIAQKIAQLDLMKNIDTKEHKFWDFQPVPKMDEKIESSDKPGPIDRIKTVDEIQKEPYKLAEGFEWSDVDVDDEKNMSEIYNLLNENYVEDDDNMFRFDYSASFLKWALKPPGWIKNWHVAVRVSKTGKMVAFITGIPATIAVYDSVIRMCEINFLCIHKKLRDKRLAPILIKEVTRRVNLTGIFQATYTAGRVLPKPVAKCRYYHRSLNPKKLIEIRFSHLQPRMTMARTIKLYQLNDKPALNGIRPLERKDVPSAAKLLNNYLKQFDIKCLFDDHEFEHWFLPRDGIINSYVIEDPKTHQITDLTSFYTLPSTVIGHPKHKTLVAAYSFYSVATSVSLVDLVKDALIFAQKNNFDVFNCLDLMENEVFIKELKFGKGDGNLQYYLYNWRCSEMPTQKVGLVLL